MITFGVTYLVEGILILSGFRVTSLPLSSGNTWLQVPCGSRQSLALLIIRFVTQERINSINLRFGSSWKPYLVTTLLIPLAFIITYLLTWMLRVAKPDWQLTSFFAMIAATGMDMSTAPHAGSPGILAWEGLALFQHELYFVGDNPDSRHRSDSGSYLPHRNI